MPSREEKESPTEDRAPNSHEDEYPQEDEGNRQAEGSEHDSAESVSVDSSEAEEREAAKDAPGVDMRAAPREHSGLYIMVFYILFSVISFVFMLTSSTTISWYKASNGDSWTLWKSANGTQWKDYPCQHKQQIFQAMEAFTISGCVLSLACVIAGILQVVGSGHMGVSIGLSFLTMAVNLVAWALGVHQYHKYNCPGEIAYVDKINRLQAGFCLTIISFGLMLFAFLALTYYFYAYFSWTETTRAQKSGAAFTSAVLIGGCLTITAVGSAFTMWEDYSATHKIKVTLWHVEILSQVTGLSEYVSYKNYNCNELNKYFQAGEAFAILSAAFLFITLLFAVAAVYSRVCKWVSFAFGVVSWVFLLVCWAIMISARYKTFCPDGLPIEVHHGLTNIPLNTQEQQVKFMGFVITEGLGMIISAWCAMSVIVIYFAVKV